MANGLPLSERFDLGSDCPAAFGAGGGGAFQRRWETAPVAIHETAKRARPSILAQTPLSPFDHIQPEAPGLRCQRSASVDVRVVDANDL